MTLEHLYGSGAAWMLYRIYNSALWPLGTFLSGIEGISLIWPAIGAVPVCAIEYSLDRRRQATRKKPLTKTNSAFVCTMVILIGSLLCGLRHSLFVVVNGVVCVCVPGKSDYGDERTSLGAGLTTANGPFRTFMASIDSEGARQLRRIGRGRILT